MRFVVAWAAAAATSACVPSMDQAVPEVPGARAVVMVWPLREDGSQALLAADVIAPIAVARARDDEVRVYLFDRDLTALGLRAGPQLLESRTALRSPVPPPLAAFAFDAAGAVRALSPASDGLRLPAIDVAREVAAGRCLDPPTFVSTACGATVALGLDAVAPPALPRWGPCPPGWSREALAIDRGSRLGLLSSEVCRPPARAVCPTPLMQAAGDASCAEIGACAGDFADGLPPDAVFVRAGAVGGDGSRAAPWGDLAEALAAHRRTIALARGQYAVQAELSGELDLIGVCAAHVALVGDIRLRQFRGELRGVQLTGLDVRERSEVRAREVWLVGRADGPTLEVDASTVTVERARVDGTGGRAVRSGASRLSLVRTQIEGSLVTESATVALDGVMLTQTEDVRSSSLFRSRLTVVDSRVVGALTVDHGVADFARVAWAPSFPQLPTGGLIGHFSRLSVRAALFDLGERGVASRLKLLVSLDHGTSTLEDVVCAGARGVDDPVGCLALLAEAPGEAHRVRRLLVSGGGRAAQLGAKGVLDAEDVSIFGSSEVAVLVLGGQATLTRVQVGDTRTGLHAVSERADLDLVVRDLAVADVAAEGVVLRDSVESSRVRADLRRVWIGGGRVGAPAISARSAVTDAPPPLTVIEAVMREVAIDSANAVGLEVGLDVRLELRSFTIARVGTAVAYRLGPPRADRRHALSHGAFAATVQAIDRAQTGEEIESLLTRVRVDAPILVRWGACRLGTCRASHRRRSGAAVKAAA